MHTSNKSGGLSTKLVELVILHRYFVPLARLTASARGCDSLVPDAFDGVEVDEVDEAEVSLEPVAPAVPVLPVALLSIVVPLAVAVGLALLPMPSPPVVVALVRFVPGAEASGLVTAGAVLVAAAVSVVLVDAPVAVVASCFGPQAVRPRARTPARRMLIGCFMIVTSG
jgi:hypothetical protein